MSDTKNEVTKEQWYYVYKSNGATNRPLTTIFAVNYK
jgi:hypothetical protein